MFLPMALSAVADAQNAINRLTEVFLAETLTATRITDPSLPCAIRVSNASFTWDGVHEETDVRKKGGKKIGKKEKKEQKEAKDKREEAQVVFQLKEIDLEIPVGKVTAIVGPVGSGKSSLLQALIGGMLFLFFRQCCDGCRLRILPEQRCARQKGKSSSTVQSAIVLKLRGFR